MNVFVDTIVAGQRVKALVDDTDNTVLGVIRHEGWHRYGAFLPSGEDLGVFSNVAAAAAEIEKHSDGYIEEAKWSPTGFAA